MGIMMSAFGVVLLNLFIAVMGETYDLAQERAEATFYKERASVCLHCMLRPRFAFAWKSLLVGLLGIAVTAALTAWFVVGAAVWYTVIPSIFLPIVMAVAMAIVDALL